MQGRRDRVWDHGPPIAAASRRALLCGVFLLAAASATARAQSEATSALEAAEAAEAVSRDAAAPAIDLPTLTLEDCLRRALQRNLGLQITEQQLFAAGAQRSAAWTQLLPRVSIYGNAAESIDIGSGYDAAALTGNLTVSQPIYHGAAVWSQWKQSALSEDQARLAVERSIQALVRDTKSRWYDLLERRALRLEAAGAVERLRQHVANAGQFFDAGRIWRNDVLQAQVELARGEQALIVADNRIRIATSQLNILMRRDVGDDFTPDGDLTKPTLDRGDFVRVVEQARAQRPDLRGAKLAVYRDGYGIDIARAGLLPNFDAQATLGVSRLPASGVVPADTYGSATASLTLSWDIWEWGKTTRRIDAAASQQRQSALRREALHDQIALEVQEAWLGVDEAAAHVTLLEQTLEQAVEQYRVTQVRYEEQLGTANDLLIAQALLTSTRSEYVSALASLLRAQAALDFAVGQQVALDARPGAAATATTTATGRP